MINIPFPRTGTLKFLDQIAKLSSSAVLRIKEKTLYTICASKDNAVIFYGCIDLPEAVSEPLRLNLPDVKRFACGIECLGIGNNKFIAKENHLRCEGVDPDTNEKTHFNYFLADDTVMPECRVNIQKILEIDHQAEFELTKEVIKKILDGLSFNTECTKLYISTQNKNLNIEINDKVLQNINNISFCFENVPVKGEEITDPVPISIELFKILSSMKNTSLKMKVNTNHKVVFLDLDDATNNLSMKYIISALVK